jgi:DNA-binding NarL/FixJ family response regulator
MDDGGTMDIPEPEPVDLSDARGWELAISLMRATEESLWPLLELFLVLILTMDTSQPMLFRFLRLGVLAYLMFQCSSDAWQIRLSRTQI